MFKNYMQVEGYTRELFERILAGSQRGLPIGLNQYLWTVWNGILEVTTETGGTVKTYRLRLAHTGSLVPASGSYQVTFRGLFSWEQTPVERTEVQEFCEQLYTVQPACSMAPF